MDCMDILIQHLRGEDRHAPKAKINKDEADEMVRFFKDQVRHQLDFISGCKSRTLWIMRDKWKRALDALDKAWPAYQGVRRVQLILCFVLISSELWQKRKI